MSLKPAAFKGNRVQLLDKDRGLVPSDRLNSARKRECAYWIPIAARRGKRLAARELMNRASAAYPPFVRLTCFAEAKFFN